MAVEPAATEVSLVVPMYNEEAALPAFFDAVARTLPGLCAGYEVVCVNDGSSDGTLAALRAVAAADHRVKVIDLSRNFGKEQALSAGLDFARGAAVIPIDADLQDPLDLIGEMLQRWREGYDVVLAARSDRSADSRFKRVTAGLFYRLMLRLSDVPLPANVGDFRLMDRRVVEALKRLPERTRFMKGIFAWLGFRQTTIYFRRQPRSAGEPKQRVGGLLRLAMEGIVSFTTAPLRIWSLLGFVVSAGAMLYMVFLLLRTLIHGVDIPGYASLITVMLFFNGLIMINLGILGEYVARIFAEVKQRPLYLVRETVNIEPSEQR